MQINYTKVSSSDMKIANMKRKALNQKRCRKKHVKMLKMIRKFIVKISYVNNNN